MEETWKVSAMGAVLPETYREWVQSLAAWPWQDALWSLGVLAFGIALGRVASWLLIRALSSRASRTSTVIDDAIAEHMPAPLRSTLPLLTARWLLPAMPLPSGWHDNLSQLLLVALIGGIGWLCFRAVRAIEYVVTTRHDITQADNLQARSVLTQASAARNVAGFVITVVTLGACLTTFSSVRQLGAGLLASAGVAGIVLGFAAQRSIATVLGGVQIALTQPIRVDDVVIVEGQWGRIEEITLTYVVVRIWDLRRLVVPISHFIEKPFENWTRVSADLLGTVDLQLDFSVPVDEVRHELKRILDASEHWDGKTWALQVTQAGERSMCVRPLMSAADSGKMWNLRCEVREKLIGFLQSEYPTALAKLRTEIEPRASLAGVVQSAP